MDALGETIVRKLQQNFKVRCHSEDEQQLGVALTPGSSGNRPRERLQGQAGDDASRRIIAEEVVRFVRSSQGVEVRAALEPVQLVGFQHRQGLSLWPYHSRWTVILKPLTSWQEEDVAALEEHIRHRLAGKGITGWV